MCSNRFKSICGNYIAISITNEFAVLFWVARQTATIQNKAANFTSPISRLCRLISFQSLQVPQDNFT
jgi:hypothetical protein